MGKTHGLTKHRTFNIWQKMRARCNCEWNKNYESYGGRGIKVCEEWDSDFKSFYDWSMANGYRDDLSIDRIDVNGNYEPSNCRWATRREQSLNKRETVYLEHNGITKTLFEWCEEYGLKYSTCFARMKYYGYSKPEEILFGRKIKTMLTYKGETKKLSQWCKEYGLKYTTCMMRMLNYKSFNTPEEILFGK